jgi:hypothetical protein
MSDITVSQMIHQPPNKGQIPRTAPPTNQLGNAPRVNPPPVNSEVGTAPLKVKSHDALAMTTFLDILNIDKGIPTDYPNVVPKSGYRYNYFEPYLERYSREDRTPSDRELSQFYPVKNDHKFHYTRIDPRIEERITRHSAIQEASKRVGDMITVVENVILPDAEPNTNIDAQGDKQKEILILKLQGEVAKMRAAKVPEEYIMEHVKKALTNLYMPTVDQAQQAVPVDENGAQYSSADAQLSLNPHPSGAPVLVAGLPATPRPNIPLPQIPQSRRIGRSGLSAFEAPQREQRRQPIPAGSSSEQQVNYDRADVMDPNNPQYIVPSSSLSMYIAGQGHRLSREQRALAQNLQDLNFGELPPAGKLRSGRPVFRTYQTFKSGRNQTSKTSSQ